MERTVDQTWTVEVGDDRTIRLPPELLEGTDLRTGDRMRIEIVDEDEIHLTRYRHPMLDLIGTFPGLSAAADLAELRNEWDR